VQTKLNIPAEISFFVVLLSTLRFVGFFGLFVINPKKNIYWLIAVVLNEIYIAFSGALFHDLMIWLCFFGLFVSYLYKISLQKKLLFAIGFIFFSFIIQNIKLDYRSKIWAQGEKTSVSLVKDVVTAKTSKSNELYSTENLLITLIRLNQGWIAASTINNTNIYKNYAGTDVLFIYIESALLPRFLAPNKLKSGDKEIFNKYSGHTIAEGTSMGLGIIADGYIAFGTTGVGFFCFALGLIFSLVFRIVGNWGKTSPFFMFLIFPILYYAVRPDCELQTTLGQLVKGTFTFFLVVRYYKNYFKVKIKSIIQTVADDEKLVLESTNGGV
jgi:hypothetical protein